MKRNCFRSPILPFRECEPADNTWCPECRASLCPWFLSRPWTSWPRCRRPSSWQRGASTAPARTTDERWSRRNRSRWEPRLEVGRPVWWGTRPWPWRSGHPRGWGHLRSVPVRCALPMKMWQHCRTEEFKKKEEFQFKNSLNSLLRFWEEVSAIKNSVLLENKTENHVEKLLVLTSFYSVKTSPIEAYSQKNVLALVLIGIDRSDLHATVFA